MRHIFKLIVWCMILLLSGYLFEVANSWQQSESFPTSPVKHVLSIFIPVKVLFLFGFLLGTKYLILQHRIYGKWHLHYSKFIWVGLFPVLLLLLVETFYKQLSMFTNLDRIDSYTMSILIFILCGYTLSKSLYKVSDRKWMHENK
ncbi:hypothetical protein N0O92_15305 [Alkalihalobacillus sp. MEB130]|uniref:hypothetical protein n=1 Tax=Alkalihalobacillus sp. MEB130 TaxID=2976704 RepID=UPI0028DF21A1|nr:hypothetical protein [Alkalihalobacillus sp. MEB130]MDT8861584.1 hypothetical protein [Alkalihalobacillus sp. MEB130]